MGCNLICCQYLYVRNIKFNFDSNSATIELVEQPSNTAFNINYKIVIISLAIGFLNGFFGGGGGMLCVPFLKKFYKLEDKVAHATTMFIMLPLSLISSILYWNKMGGFNFKYLYIICGVVLGGVVGALLLKKLSNKALNIMFSIVIIIGGIRMIF